MLIGMQQTGMMALAADNLWQGGYEGNVSHPTGWTTMVSAAPGEAVPAAVLGGGYATQVATLEKGGAPLATGSWRDVRPGSSIVLKRLNFDTSVEGQYNDNVFQTSEGKEGDVILYTTSGISYDLMPKGIKRRQKHIPLDLLLNLDFKTTTYMNHKELNEMNMRQIWGSLSPSAGCEISLRDRLILRYNLSTDTLAASSVNAEASNQQKQQLLNQVNQTAELDLKFGPRESLWLFDYKHTDTFYVQKSYQTAGNTMTDYFSLNKDFGPENRTPYLGAAVTSTRYPNRGRNNTGNLFGYAGYRGKFQKLSGDCRAGYSWVTTKQDSGTARTGAFTMIVDLQYLLTKRITMNLSLEQEPLASQDISQNFDLTDSVTLTFDYALPFLGRGASLDLGLTYTENDYSLPGARSDKVDTAVTATDNSTTGSNNKQYGLSLGCSYAINRWLTMSLGYQFTKRTSEDAVQDYDNNVYSLTLQGVF